MPERSRRPLAVGLSALGPSLFGAIPFAALVVDTYTSGVGVERAVYRAAPVRLARCAKLRLVVSRWRKRSHLDRDAGDVDRLLSGPAQRPRIDGIDLVLGS